jgi:hypothetical protein
MFMAVGQAKRFIATASAVPSDYTAVMVPLAST